MARPQATLATVPVDDLTVEDLLVVLIEEMAEVTKAATKCLRFGFERVGPGDYGKNDVVLSEEVGDLMAVLRALPLDDVAMVRKMGTKLDRVRRWKKYAEENPP